MNRIPFVFLIILLALGVESVCAAPAEYLTDVWTSEKGLPDSSVTAIAQTPDGYLWIGTYNGLARFDGVRFVTFDPANTPALTHARVRRLFVDVQGTLWVNTYDGSLTSFRNEAFALERPGGGSGDADAVLALSSSNSVTFMLGHGYIFRKPVSAPAAQGWQTFEPPSRMFAALCGGDGEGAVWYRGRDSRLWRLREGRFELLPEPSGLVGQRINCMDTSPEGRLWVGTERELAVWDGARFQNVTPTNGTPAAAFTFLAVGAGGRFWTVADDRVREGMGGRWLLEAESLRGVFTGNLSRMGAQEDHQAGAWLYDYGRGLFHVEPDGQSRRLSPEDGFPGDRVTCFFEDREGNWWAGLDPGGLVRVRERRFQTLAAGDSASAKPARSVCEDQQGAVWAGTLGGGLDCWSAGALTNLSVPGGTDKGFVYCVCPDNAGRLWVSAGDEDLFLLEHEQFTRVSPLVHGVKAILTDHAGRVWAGTKSGLFVADGGKPSEFTLNSGVGRRDVRSLAEDQSGAVWVGAGDGTLFRISAESVAPFRPPEALGSPAILAVLAEPDGTVWLGTFRGGLLRFRDGQFARFGKMDGLPDDIISQILDDNQGNLWLGSHQGIFRVSRAALDGFARGDRQPLACTVYGRSDGLPSIECSRGYQPAAWRGRDGRLWFTTLRGVVSVQPRDLHPNPLPPPVVLEDVLVDGKPQALAAGAQQALTVPPGKHQLEFRYTGLSLVSPDRVQFRYHLENADADWVEAGTRRFAQYSFLPPGDYRFQVRACNSDNVWNTDGAWLALNILPHFYETWTYRIVAGLVMVASIAGVARYIATRRLRLQLELLERQRAVERERTRIAKDIHDDLGAGLTQITLLSELARGGPAPENEAHLGQISDAARELTRAMDEIVWAIDPQNDTLDGLATYLCKFAQDYLNVAGIRCRLDLPEEMPPQPLRAEVRHNLFLAVKEALNNIVKHARATEVYVRLILARSGFTMVVEDNGRGFNPAAPASSPADAARTLPGHGLTNLDKRLAAIGGRCAIQSQPGQGTRIELTIPFDPPVVS